MENRLVPRAEWYRFFEDFSRRHEGTPATLRVLHPQLGSQIEARDLPLEGIVSAADTRGPISILLGRTANPNLEHEIPKPRQVWVELTEAGTTDLDLTLKLLDLAFEHRCLDIEFVELAAKLIALTNEAPLVALNELKRAAPTSGNVGRKVRCEVRAKLLLARLNVTERCACRSERAAGV